MTTEDLQNQMRRDPATGRLVCERCGRPAKLGWVYGFGPIVLATCTREQCRPKADRWFVGCEFSP